MNSILLAIMVLGFGHSTLAHSMDDGCNHILKGNKSISTFKAEEIFDGVAPSFEQLTAQAMTKLETGLTQLAALPMSGQGTQWRENRYDKRRAELLATFKTGSFRKLLASKAELATNVQLWSEALSRVEEIDAAFAKMDAVEQKAFASAYDAVRAAVISHALSWSKVSSRELDFPRIQHILRQIAEFDTTTPKFAFYKLKRAIETRHSLREFVECR